MSREGFVIQEKAPLRARHALMVYTSPLALFRRIEDTGAYGTALLALLLLTVLVGYAQIQTGLIDRVVDQGTEQQLAELEKSQGALVDRVQLRDQMEKIRKQGQFNKLVTRLGVVVFSPVSVLASCLSIAAVLYAVVALTGRKPEYHTLMAICVYASFIELVGHVVRLAMMLYYRTTEVETSPAMLRPPDQPTALTAVDPFRIWFWGLVILGLIVTRQLSRRMAGISCALMFLAATGVRLAIEFAPVLMKARMEGS